MALDNSSIRVLLAVLRDNAKRFPPIFDEGHERFLRTVYSEISGLLLDPDSRRTFLQTNGHVEFTNAKQRILSNVYDLYEEVEKTWMNYLASMKADFKQDIETFLDNTKLELEVKLPIPLFSTSDGNEADDSSNSFQPNGHQQSTEASTVMTSSYQNISAPVLRMETEPQASTSSSLNHSAQQVARIYTKEASPIKAPTNQVMTTNTSNGIYPTLSISNESGLSTENAIAPGFSTEPITHSTPNPPNMNNIASASLSSSGSPKKKYRCTICGKVFNYESLLKRHMPKHTGERNYPCKYCKEMFTSQGSEKNHEDSHCKKRPRVGDSGGTPSPQC